MTKTHNGSKNVLQDKKELHWIDFFCTIFFTLRKLFSDLIEEKSEGEKLIELRGENKPSNKKTS